MKKSLMVAFSLLLMSAICFAQKSSDKVMTIQYTIDPLYPAPENPVTYSSLIRTPIDPLSPQETKDLEKAGKDLDNARTEKLDAWTKEYLVIKDGKYSPSSATGDWFIKLETGDVKVLSDNQKPLSELGWEDPVFTYTCPTKLTVQDNKSGNIVFEKVIAGESEEQTLPKAVLFLNPIYKLKLALAKNNPEKLKKLGDQMLEKKNYLVLTVLLTKARIALIDAYERQPKTVNVSIFSVKGKGYDELNAVSEKIQEVYGKFHALSKKNRIPKEEFDKVMLESIPVWEKFIAEHTELEETAKKGLILNCALATTWVGEYDKAAGYFAKVEEAKPNTSLFPESDEQTTNMVTMQTFGQAAVNLRSFYEAMNKYKSRAQIFQ